MQVGTTKDQSLYNKPSAAVHPGALAAGTLPKYNTKYFIFRFFLADIISFTQMCLPNNNNNNIYNNNNGNNNTRY